MAFEGYGKVEMFWVVPDLNRKRYYSISVESGLFGPVIVRSWGRIGEGRLRKMEHFFSERALLNAVKLANRLLTAKLRKGYEIHSPLPLSLHS